MSSLYTHTHTHTLSGFHKQNVISELSENLNVCPCLGKYHAIKTYRGSGDTAPYITNLNITCSLSFAFPNETCGITSQLLPFTESWDPSNISSYGPANEIMGTIIQKRTQSLSFPPHEEKQVEKR